MRRVLARLAAAIETWVSNRTRTYNATKGKP